MEKIAFVTDDGITISAHFGRARSYVVVTVEAGREIAREQRQKPGHDTFVHEPHPVEPAGHVHGTDPASQGRHRRMLEPIADCRMVVARGMGSGAYENLKSREIQPILTDLQTIAEALQAYGQGRLLDHPERLH